MTDQQSHPVKQSRGDAELLRLLFQGKWRLQMMEVLLACPQRLSQMRHRFPDCTKKILIDNLQSLEKLGWIDRREFEGKVKRVEYGVHPDYLIPLARVIKVVKTLE